jgi:hypothetical protein
LLDVPQLQFVGHFAHACATDYAAAHDDVMTRYVESAIHAICLLKFKRQEALQIVADEPARLMRLVDDPAELERQVGCIAEMLQPKPYPSPVGIANTYEFACAEWPGSAGINPLTLWDLHWLKQLDDEGVIDTLIGEMH